MDTVSGAVLGTIFQTLLDAVLDAQKKAASFNSILKQLQTTLQSIRRSILDIDKNSQELDLPKEETEKRIQILTDGEKLIRKCSEIRCWNLYQKIKYANKLLAFDRSLGRYFLFDMQAQQGRSILGIQLSLEKMSSWSNRGGSDKFECFGSCEAPAPPDFTVGLDDPLRELKRWLFKKGGSRIVVSAPGGCGKTTLAKMLCQDPDVKGKYDIFYVVVSRTPDLISIIKKLFQYNNDYRVPEFTNEEDAVNQLKLLLNRQPGPILLVLDDVWCGSESFLDNFNFQISEYKVLVTSRNEFPRFGSTYKLKLLNDDDAMTLFRHSAFPENGSHPPRIPEDLVKEMVRRCNGFPLALKVVGSSLYGWPVEEWKSRKMKISEGESIVSSEQDLRVCLQSSLDALDSRSMLKECFMDLGSFPEDHKIPATVLIDMWAELYKLDKYGAHAISKLHKLCSQNLLNLVVTRDEENEVDGCYNDTFAVQHDLLRELAIYESSKEPIKETKRLFVDLSENGPLPEWTKEDQQPLNARLVSISTGEKFSSSWRNMQLPEAEVLILNFRAEENYTFPEFMKQMDKLKVLAVTNYGFCTAELINFSLVCHLSGLKRMRLERVSIPTFCNNTYIELKNLEKITFFMCKIGRAFGSCAIPIQGMLPNLTEININYCTDLVELPVWLCDLVGLNKLCITDCHELSALPQEIGKLGNLQVLRVSACSKLSKLPATIGSLHKLSILDITGCLAMREMPRQIGELRSLRELHMRKCGVQELPQSMVDLVDLKRVICDKETALLWESFQQHLPDLDIRVPEESINLNWLL